MPIIKTEEETETVGFSIRHLRKFAVLISIINTYQADPEWHNDVKSEVYAYLKREADRHNFPDGWERLGSYDEAIKWYKKMFIKTNQTNQP